MFAALNTLDGSIIGTCMPKHRHQEFRFLNQIKRCQTNSLPGSTTGFTPQCILVASPRVRTLMLRPLPRRAGRPSLPPVGSSGHPHGPSSNERRLGARIQPFEACSGFTRVAARTLANPPKAGLCPQGFDGLVALATAWVATKVYRHLLGPDFHRLR